MFNHDHHAIVAIKDEHTGTYKFRWLEEGAPFDHSLSEESLMHTLLKYHNKRRVRKLLNFGNLKEITYPMVQKNVDTEKPVYATIDGQLGWPSIAEMVYKTATEVRWWYIFEKGHWHICDGRMIVDLKQYIDHEGHTMFSVGETFGL